LHRSGAGDLFGDDSAEAVDPCAGSCSDSYCLMDQLHRVSRLAGLRAVEIPIF